MVRTVGFRKEGEQMNRGRKALRTAVSALIIALAALASSPPAAGAASVEVDLGPTGFNTVNSPCCSDWEGTVTFVVDEDTGVIEWNAEVSSGSDFLVITRATIKDVDGEILTGTSDVSYQPTATASGTFPGDKGALLFEPNKNFEVSVSARYCENGAIQEDPTRCTHPSRGAPVEGSFSSLSNVSPPPPDTSGGKVSADDVKVKKSTRSLSMDVKGDLADMILTLGPKRLEQLAKFRTDCYFVGTFAALDILRTSEVYVERFVAPLLLELVVDEESTAGVGLHPCNRFTLAIIIGYAQAVEEGISFNRAQSSSRGCKTGAMRLVRNDSGISIKPIAKPKLRIKCKPKIGKLKARFKGKVAKRVSKKAQLTAGSFTNPGKKPKLKVKAKAKRK